MKLFSAMTAAAVLAITIFMLVSDAEGGESSVDIINRSVGQPLSVHCQSRDDDLHWQLLQVNQDYRFVFHENFFMNTVFWCRFVWGPNGKFWQSFTVWDRLHWWEMPVACGNCIWRAQIDGMYIWNKNNQTYDLWKTWNTNGPTTFPNDTYPPVSWKLPAVNASKGEDN